MPHNNLNAFDIGQGFQSEDQNKGDGRRQLQCWICGKQHLKKDFLSYEGGRDQIYSSQDMQTFGDIVGKCIPQIYATVDNRQADHNAFTLQMDGNICD